MLNSVRLKTFTTTKFKEFSMVTIDKVIQEAVLDRANIDPNTAEVIWEYVAEDVKYRLNETYDETRIDTVMKIFKKTYEGVV